jgi:hypothetical protein
MFHKKFNFAIIVVMAMGMVAIATTGVLADSGSATTTTNTTVTLPTWLETLLYVAGVLGTGATAMLGKRVINLVSLVSDLRDTINKSTHFFYAARTKITDPDLVEDFNNTVEGIAKVLTDTGNKTLIQKASDLLKCKAKIVEKAEAINSASNTVAAPAA